jgi:hypothetical protein
MKLITPSLLTAALLASLATGVGAARAASPTVSLDCLGKPVVKPSQVILACADGNAGVKKIAWLGWGRPTAAGVGTAFANDCSPNCAAGHVHTYRSVILLSGSQSCHGEVAYRTATVAIVGEPPAAWKTAADATYPLRCA